VPADRLHADRIASVAKGFDMFIVIRCVVLATIAAALSVGTVAAHEGHDHGPPAAHAAISAAPRLQAASENFELVAVAREGMLRIYVDRFKTNEPVAGAAITVETPEGSKTASADADGSYSLTAPWSARPGHYDLIVTVVAGGSADVLTGSLDVGPPTSASAAPGEAAAARWPTSAPLSLAVLAALAGIAVGACATVFLGRRRFRRTAATIVALSCVLTAVALAHEGEGHGEGHGAPARAAAAGARDVAQRAADGSLFVPKPMQRLLGIRTDVVAAATHRRTIELPARIIPDPNASGLVQASAGGRLSPPPGGFPRLG
jgi:membrane fusion protein, heavy metal efflux system